MANLTENINVIKSIFSDIKRAIRSKGVDIVDNTPIGEYADLIIDIKPTTNLQDKIITENGEYTSDYPYHGLGVVTVATEDQWLKRAETLERMFYNKTNIDFTEFPIYNAYDIEKMFYGCNDLHEMTLTGNGISRAYYAFANCPKLEKIVFNCNLDGSGLYIPSTSDINADTSNCFSGSSADVDCLNVHWKTYPYAYALFKACKAKKIKLSTDSNSMSTGNFNDAFYNSTKLSDVDFGNVIPFRASGIFCGCSNLKKIPESLDLSKTTTLHGAFSSSGITEISSTFSAPNCVDFGQAFSGCTSLTKVGDIDLSQATDVGNLFYSCYNVIEFPSQLNLSSVTEAGNVFYRLGKNTESLRKDITLKLPEKYNGNYIFQESPFKSIHIASDTKITGSRIFYNSEHLEKITGLNLSSTTSFTDDFTGCSELVTLELEGTISNGGLNFSTCPLLSHDSIMNVINALTSTTSSQKITFGKTNLAKLTDEEKAIATDKGWTLA